MQTSKLLQILILAASMGLSRAAAADMSNVGAARGTVQSTGSLEFPGSGSNSLPGPSNPGNAALIQQSSQSSAPAQRSAVLPPQPFQELYPQVNQRYQDANSMLSLEASYLTNKLSLLADQDDSKTPEQDRVSALGIFCSDDEVSQVSEVKIDKNGQVTPGVNPCYERYKRTAYQRLVEIRKNLLQNETVESDLRSPDSTPIAAMAREPGQPVPMKTIRVPYVPTTQEVENSFAAKYRAYGPDIFNNEAWAAQFRGKFAPQETDFVQPQNVRRDAQDASQGDFAIEQREGQGRAAIPVVDRAAYQNYLNKVSKFKGGANSAEKVYARDAVSAVKSYRDLKKSKISRKAGKALITETDKDAYRMARLTMVETGNDAVKKMVGKKAGHGEMGSAAVALKGSRTPAQVRAYADTVQISTPPAVRDVPGQPDRDIDIEYGPGKASADPAQPSNDGIEGEIEKINISDK